MGAEIYRFCEELRATKYPDGLPAGQSAITPGGKLPAKWIIHTVGPKYAQHDGKEADLLASCYRTALELAGSHKLKSIASSAISTGVFGYPAEEAAKVAWTAIQEMLPKLKSLKDIRIVFFDEKGKKAWEDGLG